jgi:hypothetical protein
MMEQVYYIKDSALKAKAEATGAYLQEMEFTDGSSKNLSNHKRLMYI